MENLTFYNKFRNVPQEAQKTIQAGKLKGFTDINPMWRIKMLTETFGACGLGWKTTDVQYHVENSAGESAVFCTLNLYIFTDGKWSDPIFGVGGSKLSGKGVGDGINDEAYKMAYTDAISIACKNLGMAADIYFANDRTKYNSAVETPAPVVQARRAAKAASPAPAPAPSTGYKPMSEEMYWQIVERYAKGIPTKTGGDYRETWAKTTNAGVNEILKFDNDVENYRRGKANN